MSDCENVPENYEDLKSAFLMVQKELETTNQTLHDCKRQLNVIKTLEKEYQEEIQLLQMQDNEKTGKLNAKIVQLEEKTLLIKNDLNDKINCLENELCGKNEEITILKVELETVKLTDHTPENNHYDLIEENSNLKNLNDALIKTVEDLKVNFQLSEERNLVLEEKILQLDKDFENLKENLNCKKDELKTANELIHTLQDNFICMNDELDTYRNKPLDPKSRGNSLFAEVDDKRVQLQGTVASMRNRYLEMKRELAKHVNEITYLSNENAALNRRWETELKEKDEDKDMILESYKSQIKALKEVIESHKREEEESPQNLGEMKFFDNMLRAKKQEIEDLRQKLATRSFNQTLLTHELAEARQEIRKWRLECTQAQSTIHKLKAQIEEMELKKAVKENDEFNETALKSIIKSEKDRRGTFWANTMSNENNKENDNSGNESNAAEGEKLSTKTVHFSSDTNDANPKGPLRRATKVLISKPVFIGSVGVNKN